MALKQLKELLGLGGPSGTDSIRARVARTAADITDNVGNFIPALDPVTKKLDPSIVPAAADTHTATVTAGTFTAGKIAVGFNASGNAVLATRGTSTTTGGTTTVTKAPVPCAGFLKATPAATATTVVVYGNGSFTDTGMTPNSGVWLDTADGELTTTAPTRPADGGYETIVQQLGVAFSATLGFFTREPAVELA